MDQNKQQTDSYYKKTIPFHIFDKNLEFKVSQDLFSSFAIDHGSSLLLRSLDKDDLKNRKNILDVGCGYGVLGLSIKTITNDSFVDLVDRDALALSYTKQNAELNNISNVSAYGSLGYDSVSKQFDLIISNIPAKVGEPVLRSFLLDAHNYLEKNGSVAVVIVKELEEFVERTLTEDNILITKKEQGKGHTVFHYQFTESSNKKTSSTFESGLYDRDAVTLPKYTAKITTVYGLPEFDTLNFSTELLLNTIQNKRLSTNTVSILNPGQGYIPVVAKKLYTPSHINLVSRDLLSLHNSKRNLANHHFSEEHLSIYHEVSIPKDLHSNLILATLRDEEGIEALQEAVRDASEILEKGGHAFFTASSTTITRIVNFIKKEKLFIIRDRKKYRGYSSLYLQKQ